MKLSVINDLSTTDADSTLLHHLGKHVVYIDSPLFPGIGSKIQIVAKYPFFNRGIDSEVYFFDSNGLLFCCLFNKEDNNVKFVVVPYSDSIVNATRWDILNNVPGWFRSIIVDVKDCKD